MRHSALLQILGALASTTAWASPPYASVEQPNGKVYFGHIAYCDLREAEGDPSILREGRKAADRALPNTPLLPGDTIVTGAGRRCEAQFDTGTVVRLDGATRLRIETILAPALSSEAALTNLQLSSGRIEVRYHDYDRSEVFQVLTTATAVKLGDGAVATIEVNAFGSTGVEARSGSLHVLFAGARGKSGKETVRAGRSVVFQEGHAPSPAPTRPATLVEFQAWSEERNAASIDSSAPKDGDLEEPVRSSPPAVRDFAARSATWGAWVSSDVYGSVWRPNENDRPGWRPYLEGRWTAAGGAWFWVADEPWGWVPYHLGYWTRLKAQGWVWVPGSWFAPAWVRWSRGPMLASWRPFDFWDFYPEESTNVWLGDDTGVEYPVPPPRPPGHAVPRRPPPAGSEPPLPPDRARQREIRRVEERMRHSAGASTATLREEADSVRRSVAVLAPTEQPPERKAEVATRRGAEGAQSPTREPQQTATSTPPVVPLFTPLFGDVTPLRLRDWNPDVQAARSLGGRISYSSRDNAIRCEGCRATLVRSGSDASYSANGSGTPSASGTATSSTVAPSTPPSAAPAGGQGGSRESGPRREN